MEKKDTVEKYMQRCLTLAEYGAGFVSPNPLVGAVIVHQSIIIGEGYHRKYGTPHAEVHAIASVKNINLLKESQLYVSLEPCSHQGLTPPCCDLIIEKQIPQVYIGCKDPFPQVSGRGIAMLQAAGVRVEVGICEKECRYINRRFFTSIEQLRPYVILKWAESQDGYISGGWISSEKSKYWGHRLRALEDAIIVGTNTAIEDNPSLNIRYWNGKNPLRIVLDRTGKLSENLKLFDHTQPTLIYTALPSRKSENIEWVCLNWNEDVLKTLLNDLYLRDIRSLIVEGGAQLLQSFIDQNLYDEVYCLKGEVTMNKGVKAPKLKEINNINQL